MAHSTFDIAAHIRATTKKIYLWQLRESISNCAKAKCRLIAEIEKEAFEMLAETDAFDEYELGVVQSWSLPISYPADGIPVDLLKFGVLPIAFGLIVDAFAVSH